jgi:hypothetical protein
MTYLTRIALVSLTLAFVPACGKDASTAGVEAEMAVNANLGADALVEEHEEGTVAWRIDSDGQVKAAVTASAGTQIKQDIGGTLVYKLPSGEPKTVPLAVDAKTGLLVAAGPKLEADLTEVNYTVTVSGKPWSGVLHVPVGGTAALVTSAKATAEVKLPDVGPHGGSIQVVGDDRLEMVSDASGEVRVYVLDADLKAVTNIETRTIRLGFVAERSEMLVLRPSPVGLFFVGRLGAAIDPFKVTVSVNIGGSTRVALWGYRPGVRVIATATRAPRVRIRVNSFIEGPDVDVTARHDNGLHLGQHKDHDDNGLHLGQHKDKDDEHGRGGGDKAKVQIHDKDGPGGGDKVKVQVHDKSGPGGGDKVKVQVKTGGGGGDKVQVQAKSTGGSSGASKGGGDSSKGKK